MELIATIDDPAVIHRILAHLGLPGARDDPESAVALSRPRDDQPAPPSRWLAPGAVSESGRFRQGAGAPSLLARAERVIE